jgi:hypothetical protein
MIPILVVPHAMMGTLPQSTMFAVQMGAALEISLVQETICFSVFLHRGGTKADC